MAITSEDGQSVGLWWFGTDGLQEIEVMAVERIDYLLVVHAMPLRYRQTRRPRR